MQRADRWERLQRIADRQRGLVTNAQIAEVGIPRSTMHDQRCRGWRPVLRGVWAAPGAPDSPEQRALAAVLSCNPAVVCGWTAAWLWGLVGSAPSRVHVALLTPRRLRRDGVRIVTRVDLRPPFMTTRRGVPTLTAAATVADLAGTVEPRFLRGALIDGLQRRLFDLSEVKTAGVLTPHGQARGNLLRLLGEQAEQPVDSPFERAVRDLIAGTTLPTPAPHPFPVVLDGRRLHLDIAWPDLRVAVECDGFGFHASPAALQRDQQRHNALVRAGWRVLRVTWGTIEHEAGAFLDELTDLIEQAQRRAR